MSFEFIRKLPTPAEIRQESPMPERLVRLKEERDPVSYTHLDVYKRQAINGKTA